MSFQRIASLSILLLFGIANAADEATAEVSAAEHAFADAFAARDLERFASFIHPDAMFSGRDGPLQGRDAVLSVWSRFFESADAPFSWSPARVLVNAEGNLGMTTGPVRDPEGRHVGAFASTWSKQANGDWLVVFDIGPSCPPGDDGS